MAPLTEQRRVDRRTRGARSQKRDAREALLEAALDVFAERGYRDATIDEIAAAAGYSKGAVYWHFDGKEDLFFALLEERVDRPMRETAELLASAPADRDMAPEATRLFGRLLGDQRQRQLLILDREYWLLAVRDRRLRARYARRQRELERAFARAIEARTAHLGTPEAGRNATEVATTMLSLARGLADERLISPAAVPDHMLGEAYATIYAGAVARTSA